MPRSPCGCFGCRTSSTSFWTLPDIRLGPFPHMGVTGAALATFTGRSIGVLYQFYRLSRAQSGFASWRAISAEWRVMIQLLRVSLTGILQFAIANASWIGLVRIVSLFGGAAVAGYTVAIRIVMFFILPAWGLSNAAATLVGQNFGAGRPERAAQSVWRTGLYNMIFLGTIGIFLFRPGHADRAAVHRRSRRGADWAAMALRMLSYGNVGYAYAMVMMQAFNGAGDTSRRPS